MMLRGGLVALTVLFCITMMTVTIGLDNGYEADSVEEARINESVRDEQLADLSEPRTPAPNPILPDRFESTEPREPPPLVSDVVRLILSASFAVASAVGVWAFRNQWWLPPAEEMVGVLNLITMVYVAGVAWVVYRRVREVLRR